MSLPVHIEDDPITYPRKKGRSYHYLPTTRSKEDDLITSFPHTHKKELLSHHYLPAKRKTILHYLLAKKDDTYPRQGYLPTTRRRSLSLPTRKKMGDLVTNKEDDPISTYPQQGEQSYLPT